MVGLVATSSKRAYAIPKSAAPRAPVPVAVHCWPVPPQETLNHSSVSVAVGLWVPVHKGLFEPSECLWQEWDLILKVNLPLILSFWGFSFALGCGVSPHSCFSTVQSPLQCLPSCWGFSDLGQGVSPHGHSSEVQLLLLTLDVGYLLTASPTPHSCTVFHKLCKIFNTSLSNRLVLNDFAQLEANVSVLSTFKVG